MDKFFSHGYIDTFRHFVKEGGHYTYWDPITRARDRNVGWRIDYFFITPNLLKDLNKKGNTIVLVTHEREIAKKAKRIVEIKDGLIISDKKTK